MHAATLRELESGYEVNGKRITGIRGEKEVTLSANNHRKGSLDFLVETSEGFRIGVEVLARPSRGKMKEKLAYAEEVDEYIFVIPSGAFTDYRKREKVFKAMVREKYFPPEFNRKGLHIWLFDKKTRRITEKGLIQELYNVQA